jgi:DNA-binding LytR/AlgR family response regulator
MNITCIVVDDEPLARDVLVKYISDCPILQLKASCKSAFEAIEIIRNSSIDIVFLDINMPKLSGLSMVKSMDHPPQIIFTTAYPEYAVEGFEVDATDYLVKPFAFERFMKAVNKAIERLKARDRLNGAKDITEPGKFIVKADGKIFQIEWKDIAYFEAMGDYIKVHTTPRTIIIHGTLKSIEDRFPEGMFLKVHRSFIISPASIEFIEGNRIKIGEDFIPIGQSYRTNLETYLGGRKQ